MKYKLLTVAVAATLSTQSLAQVMLEEVMVTAQKREQSMQDVGISVTALSGDAMSKLNFNTSVEVTSQIPNAEILSSLGSGQNANLVIRGVGLNDFNNGNEAPVTAYIDEFYLIALSTVDFQMYDLERVEVLRGPQGTLFGRNSTGGLFHFVTNKPSDEFEGRLTATVAEYGEIKVDGAIGGPITDSIRGRLALSGYENDGFQEAQIPGVDDGDARQIWAARGQIEFDLGDSGLIRFKYEHADLDNTLPSYVHKSTYVDEKGLQQYVPKNVDIYGTCEGCDLLGFRGDQAGGGPNKPTSGDNAFVESETDLLQMNIIWDFDSFTLTSITGWMDHDKDYFDNDLDGGPITGITVSEVGDWNQFGGPYSTDYWTQEIRLNGNTDRARWTAGVYYMDQDAGEPAGKMNLYGAQDFVDLGILDQPFPLLGRFNWDQNAKSFAVFGQYEFDINDQFTLLAGGRYSWEEKDFSSDYKIQDPFDILGLAEAGIDLSEMTSLPFAYPYDGDLDENLWTGKVELDYRPTEDHLIYGYVSRGMKVGGFNNGQVPFILEEEVQFDEETVIAYELGWKATLMDGMSRLNLSAFYYDYGDFQTFAFQGLGSVTGNNDASLAGAEIEYYVSPAQGLDISLGASYLDTEIEDVFNGVITRDTEMAMAPKYTVNGMVRYEWDALGGLMAVQMDGMWSDERYADAVNHPSLLLEDYEVMNASVSYGSQSDSWRVTAFVKNFTDNESDVLGFPLADFFGMNQYLQNIPRQYGVTLNVNF